MAKSYLGDGVYVQEHPFGVVLTTEDQGDIPSNTIVLEPQVAAALVEYLRRMSDNPQWPDARRVSPL